MVQLDGRATTETGLVIYLEWKSATASFPPSDPFSPRRVGRASEKVKFGLAAIYLRPSLPPSLMNVCAFCCPG